jgi:ArsR family transcriptional regulator, arsenate/arsenite/antimonite-responsive transcriptional repressor
MPKCCPPPPPVDPAEDADEAMARLARALGHPARVRIMRVLLERDECMVSALVEELPLAQSTVSQHLKVLRDAGLVHGEVDGVRICYCADVGRIEQLGILLDGLMAAASAGGVAGTTQGRG